MIHNLEKLKEVKKHLCYSVIIATIKMYVQGVKDTSESTYSELLRGGDGCPALGRMARARRGVPRMPVGSCRWLRLPGAKGGHGRW